MKYLLLILSLLSLVLAGCSGVMTQYDRQGNIVDRQQVTDFSVEKDSGIIKYTPVGSQGRTLKDYFRVEYNNCSACLQGK